MRLFVLIILLIFSACSDDQKTEERQAESGYIGFFEALVSECGNAYAGEVKIQPDTINMFTGTEKMVIHFMECTDNQVIIPFHIENEDTGEWDRSRTWIITLHEDGLELRHDHRLPDGSDDEDTMYGGYTVDDGTEHIQRFQSLPRTEDAGGDFRGWRIEFYPGERYTYGTIWNSEWNIMVEFDLTETIGEPPKPWGYE
jgi:hypothetical protein